MTADRSRRRLELERDQLLADLKAEYAAESRLLVRAQTRGGLHGSFLRLLAAGHRKRARKAAVALNIVRGQINALPDRGQPLFITTPDQAKRQSIRDMHRRRTDRW